MTDPEADTAYTVPNADQQKPSPTKYPNYQRKRDTSKIRWGNQKVWEGG